MSFSPERQSPYETLSEQEAGSYEPVPVQSESIVDSQPQPETVQAEVTGTESMLGEGTQETVGAAIVQPVPAAVAEAVPIDPAPHQAEGSFARFASNLLGEAQPEVGTDESSLEAAAREEADRAFY